MGIKLFSKKTKIKSEESFLLEKEDLFSDLETKTGSSLFLGRYSLNEIKAVLRKKNFIREAKKRGLWPLDFVLDSSDYPPLQRLQIFFQTARPENLAVDLKIRERKLSLAKQYIPGIPVPELKYMTLEWLTMQDPRRDFDEERTPLPGQAHPGLSIGRKVLNLFIFLARINRDNGLLAFPAYFHNALLFSRGFKFLNPEKEGEVLAVRRSVHELSFKQLAWAVHLGCLKQQNGSVYEWKAEEQIFPLHYALRKYFDSDEYKRAVEERSRILKFTVDNEKFRKKMNDLFPSLYPES